MSKQISQSEPAGVGVLDIHLRGFIAPLAKVGYAEKTQHDKQRLIAPFIRWVHESGIAVGDVDEACVDAFLACSSRRRYKHRSALQQFVEHLRIVGAVPPCRVQPSPAEVLLQKYLAYLRDKKGLSSYSTNVYSPFVRAFVVAQRLSENAAAVNAVGVRSHVLDHGRNRCVSFVKLLAAALRSFLGFCFLDGTTATDLSTAVPPVRRWQLAPVPSFLTAEEVERVIAAADRSTTRGCRAFAILLLLARLGLRASEILALDLDDIRWEAGEVVVRGKGRLHDHLPPLTDVGEALALYLSTARGPSPSRRVFLRRKAPRTGLLQPGAVSKIAREACNVRGCWRGEKKASRTFDFPERDVRAIRERYALSQAKFAALMGISVATLRNWEQGRREPEGSARVLLRVVARHPDAVLDVVGMRATKAEQGAARDRGQQGIRKNRVRRVAGRGG